MDANVTELDSKQKKLLKEQSVDNLQDRLSKLPINIIHIILSRLSTKNAVATSILSTSWEWMWTSLPNLEFDEGITCKDPEDKMKFANFVDRVVSLHDQTSFKKFFLRCKYHDASRVTSWISAALQHNVEELNLSINVEGPMARIFLPELVCHSRFLTVLKVQSNHGIVFPTSFCLPNLKILHLRSIVYSPTHSNKPLFSSCPTLSELILDDCKMQNIGTIIISIPTVKTFWLYDTNRDSEMKVYADNLVSFFYIGGMPNDLSLFNTLALVKAYLEVTEDDPDEIGSRVNVLLTQLSSVKVLVLSNVNFWSLYFEEVPHGMFATFRNLIHLKLGTEAFMENRELFATLMENSPTLEHILLDEVHW